jgi:hypothetical protein
VTSLLEFCFKEFGPGWSLTMEQFFNYVWYARHFRPAQSMEVAVSPANAARRSLDIQVLFQQVLLAVFEESLYGFHSQNPLSETCGLHDALAERLASADTVISFNYDCLIDCSLQKHSPFWSASDSYAFSPKRDSGLRYWTGKNTSSDEPVKLLKLHGSFNWRESGDSFSLKQRPYTRQHGHTKYYIVPPVISKDKVLEGPLGNIWRTASSALSAAESIAVIGYSVPPADALANALFSSRMHLASGSASPLKTLIIANPDRTVRHRIIRSFRQSIMASTRVLVFDSFDEMNGYLFKGERQLH